MVDIGRNDGTALGDLLADKLKLTPHNIENRLAEHRKEPAYLYRVEQHILLSLIHI